MHGRWMIRRGDGACACRRACRRSGTPRSRSLALLESGVDPADAGGAAGRGLAAAARRSASPATGAVQVAGRRAERLGVRVRERSLSRTSTTPRWSLLALHKAGALDDADPRRARSRWVLAMQSRNGGWAAFDKDNTSRLPALHPVRGLRRDDRSAERRRHRARRRDARRARRRSRAHPAVGAGARATSTPSRSRRARGSGAGASTTSTASARCCPALAAVGRADGQPRGAARGALARSSARTPTAASARAARRTSMREARGAGREHAVADRMGAARRWSRPVAPTRRAARRAARYLIDDAARRRRAGTRSAFTGCGFPGYGVGEQRGARIREGRELVAGFMLRYHLYRNCFPAARARPLSRRARPSGRRAR